MANWTSAAIFNTNIVVTLSTWCYKWLPQKIGQTKSVLHNLSDTFAVAEDSFGCDGRSLLLHIFLCFA